MNDAEKKLKARNKYINEWQKEKYYRLTVLIPKEQKEVLYNNAIKKGFKNTSDYIKALIDLDLQDNNFQDFQLGGNYNNFSDGSGLPFG